MLFRSSEAPHAGFAREDAHPEDEEEVEEASDSGGEGGSTRGRGRTRVAPQMASDICSMRGTAEAISLLGLGNKLSIC